MENQFQKELKELINRHSRENGSNTPDFILADYLTKCLEAFNFTSNWREEWYGRGPVVQSAPATSTSKYLFNAPID